MDSFLTIPTDHFMLKIIKKNKQLLLDTFGKFFSPFQSLSKKTASNFENSRLEKENLNYVLLLLGMLAQFQMMRHLNFKFNQNLYCN